MRTNALAVIISIVFVGSLLWTGEARNSTWGHVGPYDYLLNRQAIIANSRWLQVITRDAIYPPRGYVNYYNITAIKAIDHDRKNGGYASLSSGGIGRRNVTVHLQSQRSYGLNFTVEIYGH